MSISKDTHGQEVSVGSYVRILQLPSSTLESLPDTERQLVSSMIGDVFQIYEIDEYGSAWVEKVWHNANKGEHTSHSVGLSAHEMELTNIVVP